jgi:hypothetical protein
LAHAEANARILAALLGSDLGTVRSVEQVNPASEEAALVVAVTYSLLVDAGIEGDQDPSEASVTTSDIMEFVPEEHRPLYAAFRERVMALDPEISSAPAPVRSGRRRYEGFRVRGRNVIYAGFRRHEVRLSFELPEGHGLAPDEFVTRGRRDWRVVMLTSPHQLDGAVALAKDTVTAFKI